MTDGKSTITNGNAVLGIEFGSTRIKAVLVDENNTPIASGTHDWENRLENGIWTYSQDDIMTGLRGCYKSLNDDVYEKYGVKIKRLGAMGISAMMHGYLAFDRSGRLLVPFRTWRNTMTGEAAEELTELFDFNIPQRWSIAHLYQAILNGEEHVGRIDFLTTLDGYIHMLLTGEKVLGVGSASGMFPIDTAKKDYNSEMLRKFDRLTEPKGYPWKTRDILPKVLMAGDRAGVLTKEGAALIDPEGLLEEGCPLCPPEGDAGTGMAATNSVAPRTGNVSAGTSVFAMIVLEKELDKVHSEIDMVTTPAGDAVAMVHCNNCTSDLNAWVGLFGEFAQAFGIKADKGALFETLYKKALEGSSDCGGLLAYNYFSGEPITGLSEGRPLFVRSPESRLHLADFMRAHLYSALATLKVGLDILMREESAVVESITGHGGFFKTKGVGQKFLADAMNAPVSVMETAGEGGAWGMALLASYMLRHSSGETLEAYLKNKVFIKTAAETIKPDENDAKGFDIFMDNYKKGLPIEIAAARHI